MVIIIITEIDQGNEKIILLELGLGFGIGYKKGHQILIRRQIGDEGVRIRERAGRC